MSELISGISKLSPFSRRNTEDEDDVGDTIDGATGHQSHQSSTSKSQLRVSHALKSFIIKEGILNKHEVGLDLENHTPALQSLLNRSHINVPPEVVDRSHPLPDYFISSSHNTYLMAHQLYGKSCATAYETALFTGSRCVEIDAWDNGDNLEEPKVTHGYTLVSNISFRAVCETIRDVVDKEAADGIHAAPILLSLENHCNDKGQLRLVQIMKEIWGDRLLSKAVRDQGMEGLDEHVTLAELGNKIVVIVEHHLPDEVESSDSEGDEDDEEARKAQEQYRQQKRDQGAGIIIPELKELGVYAQSVKPMNNSWFESTLENAPHHHLINVSESGLKTHMPAENAKIAIHNSKHLMRVYPKGTRISSRNLRPVPFWGVGAQVCALNWQTYGASSQLNEALFAGSDGYVLKPAALRKGGNGNLGTGRKRRLRLHVAGATDIQLPNGRTDDPIPYVTCTLVHPSDLDDKPPKKKTSPYKPHKLTGFLHRENPPAIDPMFEEVLEWEYEDNELAFLRLLIKSDDAFARNPVLVVAAVRLMYVVPGWNFIRMRDLKGDETKCTLLVRFEFQDL